MFTRFLVFLGLEICGFIAVLYAFTLVRTFGHMDWAEHYLGSGGSYTAWRLIGIAMIAAGFLELKYGFI